MIGLIVIVLGGVLLLAATRTVTSRLMRSTAAPPG